MKNTNPAISVIVRGANREKINEILRKYLGKDAEPYLRAKAITILRLPGYETQFAEKLLARESIINVYFDGFTCTHFEQLVLSNFIAHREGRKRLFKDQQAHLFGHLSVALASELLDDDLAEDILWLSGSRKHKQYGIVFNAEFPQREFKFLVTMLWTWLGDTLLEGVPFPSLEEAKSTLRIFYNRKPLIFTEEDINKRAR